MIEDIDKRIIDKGFHTGYEVDFVTIQQSDYEYLKEQAERVEGLLKQTGYNFKVLRKLDAQNKRYREALVRLRNDINKQETWYEKNVFVIKTVDDALIDWEALGG